MLPHPQSRQSLLRLNEQLRQQALSRARALANLDDKREFERLLRATGAGLTRRKPPTRWTAQMVKP